MQRVAHDLEIVRSIGELRRDDPTYIRIVVPWLKVKWRVPVAAVYSEVANGRRWIEREVADGAAQRG